jgi:flagellar biosynthetic protein FliO
MGSPADRRRASPPRAASLAFPMAPTLFLPRAALALIEPERSADLGGASGPDRTRYLLACAGLIVLVGGLAWFARRYLSGTLKARAGRRALQVLDLLPLGGRQRLAVVRCYDRAFFVGLGDKEISLLCELDAGALPAADAAAPSTDAQSFADLLTRVRPRAAAADPARPLLQGEGILG